MQIQSIPHGSAAYKEMIDLRVLALLEPIGLSVAYINKESEATDYLLGAYETEKLVGCCVLTPRSPLQVQLRQMAVHPDAQGKGLGAAILRHAEDVAAREGYTQLFMHARNGVIPFYEKCGYKKEGEEFFEVGIGHHRMVKRLR
jgi:GNAT superfamily N-acetyltransferase